MQKKLLWLLILLSLIGLCNAQTVSNIRSEWISEAGYYIITYDLSGSKNDAYYVKLIPYLDDMEVTNLTFVGEQGEDDVVSPSKSLKLYWHPLLEGVGQGNWRFRIEAKLSSFVYVPGGTFTMGDTRGVGGSDEQPTHSVTLDSFYICKYLVTQGEYEAIMGFNPAGDFGVGANYPVYYVSWYDAIKYCNLRSMGEGLTPVYSISGSTDPSTWGTVPTSNNYTWNAAICNWNANGYRLPTEAEWEYAASGATNNPDYLYSGSDDIDEVAWYWDNSSDGTKPVGTKAPNALGIYDMSGNVWEWCWDWYGGSYYSNSSANNPTGPTSGSYRVLRGGSWYDNASDCRVTYRDYSYPYYSVNYFGFRLCRAVL